MPGMRILVAVALLGLACEKKKDEAAPPPSPSPSPSPAPPPTTAAAPPAQAAPAPAPSGRALATNKLTAIASPAKFCKTMKLEEGHEPCDPKARTPWGDSDPPKVLAPWKGVTVMTSGEPEAGDVTDSTGHLFLQTEKGWFVMSEPWSEGIEQNLTHMKKFQFEDFIPGGAPELVLVLERNGGVIEEDRFEREELILCGLGASGEPSCSEPLVVSNTTPEPAWRVDVTAAADGTLTVKPKEGKPPAEALERRTIAF